MLGLNRLSVFFISMVLCCASGVAFAQAPWGQAKYEPRDYKPQKVVYDAAVNSEKKLISVLDRASYLSKLTGADPFDSSIVIVLHGPEINYFAIENYAKYKDLVTRAQSLTVGGTVTFRMCKLAAEGLGFAPKDIHGFIEIVPMGDAEIIRLQYEEGHAYMR